MHMDNTLLSEIFFFTASVSIIFITIALFIALIYIIKILRDARRFLQAVRSGTEALSEDLSDARARLKDKGILTGLIFSIITLIAGFGQKIKQRKARKSENKQNN